MPCDTVYQTSAMDLAKLDKGILAESLKASGWSVTVSGGSLFAYGPRGASLNVTETSGSLTLRSGANAAAIEREIREAYGRTATTRTAQKFGFRTLGETRLSDGSLQIKLGRAMVRPLGKVGL